MEPVDKKMAALISGIEADVRAEEEKTIAFPPPDLATFVPAVARGRWNPKKDG